MEFTRRMAEAGALLDFVFTQLEEHLIRPMLKMSFQTILQYTPQDEFAHWIETRQDKYPDIADKLEALKGLSPLERYNLLAFDLDFQTRVFSAIFDRQQEIEKITYTTGIIGKIPQAAQHIKWANLLRKLIEAFSWDADEIVSDTPLQDPWASQERKPGNPVAASMGSDGGESMPSGPPMANQSEGQAMSLLGSPTGIGGSTGGSVPGLDKLMGTTPMSGNAKNTDQRTGK
jgi:hypothetical protein